MPEINSIDLERQLKAGKPSRVYLIYGSEVWLKQQAVNLLLRACVPQELPEFNYQRFDGTRDDLQQLPDAISQFPMMADKRCVLIEDFNVTRASGSDMSILLECVKNVPECCVLIIWQNDDTTTDKNSNLKKLVEACKKHGSVMNMVPPRASDVARILCNNAQRMGLKMGTPEAYHMIDFCGSDLTNLLVELEKLSVIAGKKAISREMISEYCSPSVDADVYKISKSILSGKNDEAFNCARRLMAQKVSPVSIFNIMSGNFIDLYRAKVFALAGNGADEMANIFPSDYKGRGFRATNALRDQGNYSMPQLRKFINLLYEAELSLKGGKSDKAVCLEQLIARLCMVRKDSYR